MGLKTTNYTIDNYGIVLSEAYARLTNINVNLEGDAFGTFEITQTREGLEDLQPLERVHIHTTIDKKEPLHSQLYIKAKEELFPNWEDDIVE